MTILKRKTQLEDDRDRIHRLHLSCLMRPTLQSRYTKGNLIQYKDEYNETDHGAPEERKNIVVVFYNFRSRSTGANRERGERAAEIWNVDLSTHSMAPAPSQPVEVRDLYE